MTAAPRVYQGKPPKLGLEVPRGSGRPGPYHCVQSVWVVLVSSSIQRRAGLGDDRTAPVGERTNHGFEGAAPLPPPPGNSNTSHFDHTNSSPNHPYTNVRAPEALVPRHESSRVARRRVARIRPSGNAVVTLIQLRDPMTRSPVDRRVI